MSATDRMLRQIAAEARNPFPRLVTWRSIDGDGDGTAVTVACVGDLERALRDSIDRIAESARLCPRCGHIGETDCECAAVAARKGG